MSKFRVWMVIAIVAALGAFVAGCGGDDDAATPAASTAAATTDAAPPAATGDAVAGKTTFEGTCQGCHTEGGTVAGNGPVLAGKGLTAERISTQIKTPRNAMPPNLVSGADLDNVVAFVLSIQ
jgi:mono/diheme cytochrome c family protein